MKDNKVMHLVSFVFMASIDLGQFLGRAFQAEVLVIRHHARQKRDLHHRICTS
jgi:hypothetical protein